MNRRLFLKFSTASLAIGSSQSLMAMPEPDLDIFIKDMCEDDTFNLYEQEPSFASFSEFSTLKNISIKLKQAQRYVGYGNFNLLGFDDLLHISKNYTKIGKFSKEELDFIDKTFYTQASDYGFYGEKVTFNLTDKINKKDTYKVPYTGHYLYQGEPLELYNRLKREVGPSIVLTSGVRSVVKQLDLFLYKANKLKGDYSKTSHSLAPAGYSFHGISDFDVGKVGFGYKNFTSSFANTLEYKNLQKLGYIDIRYPKNNPYGVRFEPWHIKV